MTRVKDSGEICPWSFTESTEKDIRNFSDGTAANIATQTITQKTP